jgi:hypothetical protein
MYLERERERERANEISLKCQDESLLDYQYAPLKKWGTGRIQVTGPFQRLGTNGRVEGMKKG